MEHAFDPSVHFDPFAAKKPDPAVLVRQASADFMAAQSPRANLMGSVSAIGLVSADFGRAYA